ncbi:Uncharacterised protein [uncultured archaeon]|nr:Uncharacterised protein [uncultured archaeon]
MQTMLANPAEHINALIYAGQKLTRIRHEIQN